MLTDKPDAFEESTISRGGFLSDFPPRFWHLVLAASCIVAVYLAGVTNRWLPTPDSALYLALGRSLANGEGYRFNGIVHSHVTPGLPMVIAVLRVLFGGGFWAPNLFIALCGLATIWLAYLTIARLSDRRTALAVALITAFSYTFYFTGHRILTDIPFAAIFWAVLYVSLRYRSGGSVWWIVLAGLLTAVGVTVRAPGLVIIAPLAIGLVLDRSLNVGRRRRLISGGVVLAVAVIAAGAFYLLGYAATGSTPSYATGGTRLMTVKAVDHLRDIGEGLLRLPVVFSEVFTSQKAFIPVGVVVLLLVIMGTVEIWRRGQRLIPITVVPYVIGLIVLGGPFAVGKRYFVSVQSMFAYASVAGLWWSVGLICRRRARPLRPEVVLKAVTLVTAFLIICNVPRLSRDAFYYSYLSHTPRYYEVIREGRHAERILVADILKQAAPPDAKVAVRLEEVRYLHFLSGRLMVPFPETARETPADAEVVYQFVVSNPDVGLIVLNVGAGDDDDEATASEDFIQHLRKLMREAPGLELLHEGERFVVYRRSAPIGCPLPAGN